MSISSSRPIWSSYGKSFEFSFILQTDRIYRQKRRTNKGESAAAVLYAKLIYSEKSNKISSPFTTQKENKKLVHLTILINNVRLKWL